MSAPSAPRSGTTESFRSESSSPSAPRSGTTESFRSASPSPRSGTAEPFRPSAPSSSPSISSPRSGTTESFRSLPSSLVSLAAPHALAYFTGEGSDGLHLALSEDGLAWRPVAGGRGLFRAEVGDENLMRDPFILPAPDGSGYHLLWTTGWRGRSIGYAFSPDLVSWSGARALPVLAGLPDAQNAWAPEAVFDPSVGDYLVYFATRQPSRHEGHRMLAIRTRDFQGFTGPEIFYDPGHSVIDAHLVPDPARSRWVMIAKDERPGHKRLFTATAPSPSGPWSAPSAPISDTLCEGATTLRATEGWLVLYDAYGAERTRAFTTADLAAFAPGDRALRFDDFPARVRHPTAFPLDRAAYARLASLS